MLKKVITIGFVLCLLCRASVGAQAINNGLSGTIISASKSAPNDGSTVTIYTTPATGHFVLTEVGSAAGVAVDSGPLLFSVTGFGPIAQFESGGSSTIGLVSSAHQFSPGLALPQRASIQCSYPGPSDPASDCYITGVLEKY